MTSEPGEAPDPPEAGFLDLGSQRLEYRRTIPRRAGATTIVLLHEGLGSADGWWPFADGLAKASGCPVFAYSRAGYGRSSRITRPRPLDYLEREAAEVLPHVLEVVGISDCILIGHSDGATIAALAAASGDPRIRGAALIAPHVVAEAATIEGVARATQAFEEGDLRRRLATRHMDVDGAFRGWSDAWLDPQRSGWDVRTTLETVIVPLLLVQGESDRYGTVLQIDGVRQSCPQVEVHHLPERGHSPQDEDPSGIMCMIIEYFTKTEVLR
ncbi:alpha/beta fold hydrolase [Methylobacterium sp. R2-1]|uniref:alpha/beta fold hydrolase n=1 Tax=Methylobacterium sp. R2-1 TaxID=2587064 RepID=UPI00161C42A6|nr:alpha/beta fold hydrolase [Methylobacterium sp. R2-1]MBB2963325.1 pimeloyl-ACP methyl ester carboxylesterase [Methylobacterium sp. R2-1]